MDNHEGNALIYIIFISSPCKGGGFIPERKNLVGQHFGDFKVTEMLWNYQNKRRTYCKCLGIDGREYIIRQDALISGATRTTHGVCSGGISKDITGIRYGRLIAIEPTSQRASNGGVRWKCQCDCGNIVYPVYNNLVRRHTTSCGCAKNDYLKSCRLDVIGKKYGYLTILGDIESDKKASRKVRCLCDCGTIHTCILSDITAGHTLSCGCMSISKGEMCIEEILKSLNIFYEKQKRFEDCKDKKTLPFDFYIPDYNICIEYDGEQHFKPVEIWGGEEFFEIRRHHDKIKDSYCQTNNIQLVRIPYTNTKDEIYNIIVNLMSPATTTV